MPEDNGNLSVSISENEPVGEAQPLTDKDLENTTGGWWDIGVTCNLCGTYLWHAEYASHMRDEHPDVER